MKSNSSSMMTRQILRYDFLHVLRKSVPMLLFGLILFGIAVPFSTSMIHEISIFNLDYTHDQIKFQFAAERVLPLIQAMAVLYGAAVGFTQFLFLTDPRRSAFYLSLGLKRSRLFLVRITVGLFVITVSIAVPYAASGILNGIALGGYRFLTSYLVYSVLGLILEALAAMLAAAAACCLTGTSGESVLLTAGILALPTVLTSLFNELTGLFLWGGVFGVNTYAGALVGDSLTERLSILNPLTFFYRDLVGCNQFARQMDQKYPDPVEWNRVVIWALVCGLAVVLVSRLFIGRKSEHAGIAGQNPLSRWMTILLWPLGVCTAVMYFMQELGRKTSFAAALAAMLIAFAVCVSLVPGRSGMSRKGLLTGMVCLVLCAVIPAGVIRQGMFGYGNRIPDLQEIQSVSITYDGQPAFLSEPANSVSSGMSYYSDGVLTFNVPEGVETARSIHQSFIQSGYRETGIQDDTGEWILPYDIHITYELTSGKTVERYYDRASADQLEQLLSLEDNEEFRDSIRKVITGALSGSLWNSQAFAEGTVYFAGNRMQDIREIRMDEENRQLLLTALADDAAEQSVEDRYFPESESSAMLYFTLNGESDLESMGCSASNAAIHLTGAYERTMALMEQWGISQNRSEDASGSSIEGIILQKFDPFASMNRMTDPISLLFQTYRSSGSDDFILSKDFGNRPEITDPQQIAELEPALRSISFMSRGGYLAAVRMTGSEDYVYEFIPEDAAPVWLQEKMQ